MKKVKDYWDDRSYVFNRSNLDDMYKNREIVKEQYDAYIVIYARSVMIRIKEKC
ncbi:MAG: hypothetical protein Pg6B_09260 [Candidatus Azobacteroides pseudotrichonymphae]|jgi:hypothetical protein|nr:MAG: hypothetical protein Pg6B_09260 [Candidatus Azobacteroides pseudotrichonymphae]